MNRPEITTPNHIFDNFWSRMAPEGVNVSIVDIFKNHKSYLPTIDGLQDEFQNKIIIFAHYNSLLIINDSSLHSF